MATDRIGRIALLWRGDRDARAKAKPTNNRLSPVFEALAAVNVAAEPAVYSDEMVDEVRDQLLRLDGVLVWVDPISDGRDRSKLDPMCFPSNENFSALQSPSSTARPSSSIPARVLGSIGPSKVRISPKTSSPRPTPRTTRPPDRWSSVTVSRASFHG
jgi:hypothetical protein